mmetsp:Transcript_28631/g.42509  ORF Transcript_28631/g.42509 Transcript_28631/m.42509 type:complete len:138 (-) Transcript_28631:1159-1572(-)
MANLIRRRPKLRVYNFIIATIITIPYQSIKFSRLARHTHSCCILISIRQVHCNGVSHDHLNVPCVICSCRMVTAHSLILVQSMKEALLQLSNKKTGGYALSSKLAPRRESSPHSNFPTPPIFKSGNVKIQLQQKKKH